MNKYIQATLFIFSPHFLPVEPQNLNTSFSSYDYQELHPNLPTARFTLTNSPSQWYETVAISNNRNKASSSCEIGIFWKS